MLKKVVQDINTVEEQYRSLYEKQDDGTFRLKLEDDENTDGLKSALEKERKARREAEKSLRETVEKYKDIDPEKAREAQKKLQELQEKELLDAGKVDELVAARTERMKADFESQLEALKAKNKELDGKLSERTQQLTAVKVDKVITDAVVSVGAVRKGAMPDVLSRARAVWKINDAGEAVALNPEGATIYGNDGTSPMRPEEWANSLLKDAPHLFEGSGGSGSENNQGLGGKNPKQIDRNDQKAFGENLEDIASGKVQVV